MRQEFVARWFTYFVDCDMRKSGLTLVVDDKTEVLLLGSLPSDVSPFSRCEAAFLKPKPQT